jgi:hypothetical protein
MTRVAMNETVSAMVPRLPLRQLRDHAADILALELAADISCQESDATARLAATPPGWAEFAQRNAGLAATLSRILLLSRGAHQASATSSTSKPSVLAR